MSSTAPHSTTNAVLSGLMVACTLTWLLYAGALSSRERREAFSPPLLALSHPKGLVVVRGLLLALLGPAMAGQIQLVGALLGQRTVRGTPSLPRRRVVASSRRVRRPGAIPWPRWRSCRGPCTLRRAAPTPSLSLLASWLVQSQRPRGVSCASFYRSDLAPTPGDR
ncbi:hypothetical protein CC85DRAFT_47292 [Cutaneotrichosporon oleaginosum]|uniref:Uncharacterized protein n=1 Tax=Cutaneotrichosporon oleaginosum TaxID=879819 RepID=A0A0J1B6W8_9TREE|nr:uncharacterized protein CC85DRAFT_47292 [Cutaneotrichosporon oleaginosum]KLT43464.1 hypothetical protein CC85DRAFT_47292 [Cutaneotrichosporon oleaginosum]TXT05630.1 hypothetical protein COLE_06950 [Cutaneotrichosporon oleaginosum]